MAQTDARIISKAHAHHQTMEKHVQSFKKIGIKFMRSNAHEVPTVCINRRWKMTKFTM